MSKSRASPGAHERDRASHCDRRSVEKYVRDKEADSSVWEDTGVPRV